MANPCQRDALTSTQIPPMTINPEQRDALYASIIVRLTGINDVYLAVEEGEFEVADRLSSEFADYLRLLHDDLGWGDRRQSRRSS